MINHLSAAAATATGYPMPVRYRLTLPSVRQACPPGRAGCARGALAFSPEPGRGAAGPRR